MRLDDLPGIPKDPLTDKERAQVEEQSKDAHVLLESNSSAKGDALVTEFLQMASTHLSNSRHKHRHRHKQVRARILVLCWNARSAGNRFPTPEPPLTHDTTRVRTQAPFSANAQVDPEMFQGAFGAVLFDASACIPNILGDV